MVAGVYTITANAQGFQQFQAHVEVTVGGHATVPIKFALTGAQQTVTVIDEGGKLSIRRLRKYRRSSAVHKSPSCPASLATRTTLSLSRGALAL